MKLVDLQCTKCMHKFEDLVSGNKYPPCPVCNSTEVIKKLSAVASIGSTGSGSSTATAPSSGGCTSFG